MIRNRSLNCLQDRKLGHQRQGWEGDFSLIPWVSGMGKLKGRGADRETVRPAPRIQKAWWCLVCKPLSPPPIS